MTLANRKIVYYVDPMTSGEAFQELQAAVTNDIVGDRTLIRIPSVERLFSRIVQPVNRIDMIAVLAESLVKTGDELFMMVSTLKQLIKFSYVMDNEGGYRPRDTKIMLMISDKIDRTLLREALDIDDVLIGFHYGGKFTLDDIREHALKLDQGIIGVPKKIRDLLKPKKKKQKSVTEIITLTPRQSQIYRLISTRGASNKTIAKTLNISESTVKLHISAILKKYGVRNRTQLAVFSKLVPEHT